MQNMKKLLLALLAVASTATTGCTFGSNSKVIAMPGVVEYSMGELRVIEDVNLDVVWNAAIKALKDLDIKVTHTTKDKLCGEIIAHRADDSKITIKLNKGPKDVTQIAIKAGALGDQATSQAIYAQLKANL